MTQPEPSPPKRTEKVPSSPASARGEVVCAILSEDADEPAAQLGARLADLLALRLALVRVKPPLPPHAAMPAEGPHPLTPVGPTGPTAEPVEPPPPVQGDREDWEHRLVTSQPIRHDMVAAPPSEALRSMAEAPDTRLLIAGDHGGGPLYSKLTANAGRDVVRDVRCPLVLVTPGYDVARANLASIVCGVDEADETAPAARLAAILAQRLAGSLHAVHVVARPVAGDPPRQIELDALDDNRRRSTEAAFETCRTALEPHVTPDSYVAVEGDTADGLRAAAEALDAGLIVIGRPSHATLGSALLGSAAHDLLRDGAIAVVLAPQAGTDEAIRWAGSPTDEHS